MKEAGLLIHGESSCNLPASVLEKRPAGADAGSYVQMLHRFWLSNAKHCFLDNPLNGNYCNIGPIPSIRWSLAFQNFILTSQLLPRTGASGAMFTYLEEVENITFVSQGVTLERISLDSFMSISSGTADSLELIKPLPGGSSREKKELTLFRWLNQTTTKPGARLVPPRNTPTPLLSALPFSMQNRNCY